MTTAFLALSLLLVFTSFRDAVAQENYARPRVGLVLSGGGACGLAHIGVLRVLEEAGLKPDIITGVSMGSIVGGLYSLGYSADSLEKISKSIDWNAVFSNQIPENKVIFPEKIHFQNSIISLPVSFKKVILPKGLINCQQVESMLSFYAWPGADINDFSKLPIPFMCMATDLVRLRKVELTGGYLPDAMRASMAVPSFLTPLKIDTLLLIDGGFLRNFAASEARKMGADILIGSYTGGRHNSEEELESIADVLMQLGFYPGIEDYQEEKKLVDILIEPPLDDCAGTDFEDVDTIINRGYKAAVPFRERIRRLSDSLNTIAPPAKHVSLLAKQYYKIDKIEINGNKIHSDKQILGVLNIKPGDSIDKYMITEKTDLLFGKVWFDKIKYRFIPRNDSLILAIECTEKPRAIFYGSVHYDESALTSAVIGLTVNNLLGRQSVIDLNSSIGRYYKIILSYSQFADRYKKFGLSATLYADNSMIPLMKIGDERGNTLSRNMIAGLSLVKRIGLNQMLEISGSYDIMNLIPDFITRSRINKLSYNYLTESFDYAINTLNTKYFPDRGMIFSLQAASSKLSSAGRLTESENVSYRQDEEFKRFYTGMISYRHYFSPAKKVTFSLGGNALYMTDTDTLSAQNSFCLLGGSRAVSRRSVAVTGFQTGEIAARKFAGFDTGIDLEIMPSFHLYMDASFCVTIENEREIRNSFYNGYGIGAGYMTVLGPLKAGIMYGRNRNSSYFDDLKGFISFGYYF